MSVAEIGRCSILGGMKHMQRGARMGMYGILNILVVQYLYCMGKFISTKLVPS